MFSLKRKSLMFMMGAFAASTALQSLNVSDAFAQATSQLSQGFVKGPGKRVSLTPKNNLEISSDETEIFGWGDKSSRGLCGPACFPCFSGPYDA